MLQQGLQAAAHGEAGFGGAAHDEARICLPVGRPGIGIGRQRHGRQGILWRGLGRRPRRDEPLERADALAGDRRQGAGREVDRAGAAYGPAVFVEVELLRQPGHDRHGPRRRHGRRRHRGHRGHRGRRLLRQRFGLLHLEADRRQIGAAREPRRQVRRRGDRVRVARPCRLRVHAQPDLLVELEARDVGVELAIEPIGQFRVRQVVVLRIALPELGEEHQRSPSGSLPCGTAAGGVASGAAGWPRVGAGGAAGAGCPPIQPGRLSQRLR